MSDKPDWRKEAWEVHPVSALLVQQGERAGGAMPTWELLLEQSCWVEGESGGQKHGAHSCDIRMGNRAGQSDLLREGPSATDSL